MQGEFRLSLLRVGLGCTAFASVLAISLDEGLRRCIQFWVIVFPLWVHYLWVDKVSHKRGGPNEEARQAKFESLHARYSPVIRCATMYMRGFYLKAAQLMSTRDDFLPDVYLKWTRELQDEVPMAISSAEAQQVVVRELQLVSEGIEAILTDWHDEPIGSASIGQVYKARDKATGKWVAIKVQVPGSERIFRMDIACLKLFTYWALPWAYENMVEIEKQFQAEFNYMDELRNMQVMRSNLLPQWGNFIHIPEPFPNLCSRRVLTMELLHGEKLVNAVRRQLASFAQAKGKTVEEFEREYLAALRSGKQRAQRPNWIKWKMTIWRWARLILRDDAPEPLDLGQLVELLMSIHGQQVLIHGCFNADPHPGNILLLEDGKTLGLIDFGQVIYVPVEFRIKLAKLVLALASRSPSAVARCEREIGVRRKYYKEDVQYRICSFWMDRDTEDVMQGLSIFDLLLWGESEDPITELPEGYYMVCRCSVTMRSMALAFGVRISTSESWRPYAAEALQEHSLDCSSYPRNRSKSLSCE